MTVKYNCKRQPIPRQTNAPLVSIHDTLVAEVERTAERHEAACLDLRRWLLSHPREDEPTQPSIYESRSPLVMRRPWPNHGD